MDEIVLQRMIEELPFAYAYHRMVWGDNGAPEDYVFVEVNSAFEHMTALNRDDILGKRVTEVIPAIREDPADWIGVYGEVARSRKSVNFRQFSNGLGRWYNVYAFSPEPDHFATVFMDITQIVDEQNEQMELLGGLNDVILELDDDLKIRKVLMSPDTPVPLPSDRLPVNAEALIGLDANDFLGQAGSQEFLQAVERARQSHGKVLYFQPMKLNGQDVWYQLVINSTTIQNRRRFIVSIINVTEQKDLERRLIENEALFQTVFEQAPIGITITRKGPGPYASILDVSSVNQAYLDIMGRTREELHTLSWPAITHPDDLAADLSQLDRLQAGEIDHYRMEKRYIRPDGSVIWVNFSASTLQNEGNRDISHLCLLEDITQRKLLEQSLKESERSKSVLLSHLPGLAYRCRYDPQWTMQFVSDGCYALTGYKPESLLNNRDLSYNDLIAPEYRKLLYDEWKRVIAANGNFRYEYEIVTASGQRKWVLEMGQPVFDDAGRLEALEGVVFDIAEQKSREERIRFLSEHDEITQLNNLMYFDRACRNHNLLHTFPLAVVQCDVDGLRLINSAFGIEEGNRLLARVASLLQTYCPEGAVLARTGDDDFTLLMPGAGGEAAEAFIRSMTERIDADNECTEALYRTSLSFGYGLRQAPQDDISVMLRAAFNSLNNRKILNAQSSHSATLTSIMATLHARSEETEEHAQRLWELSEAMGLKMGLSQKIMAELALFSKLHDIGKIGISDAILNKPGKLTEEEWMVMKRHPEIGYQIARSLEDIAHVAEDILSHHERWDGLGYPRGLKGEQIPLAARILAVADAYDAMTKDRVYRKAMPREQALAEIWQNIGKQFDPEIAQLFLSLHPS